VVRRGERIAQMIISPVCQAQWEPVTELPATRRNEGGFGHTGKGIEDLQLKEESSLSPGGEG